MKNRIILVCTLLFGAILWGTAQNTDFKKEFAEKHRTLSKEMQKAEAEKQYAKVVQCTWGIIKAYEAMPAEAQNESGFNKGAYLYHIAGYEAMQKHKKAAVDAFEKAYLNGFKSYAYILKDTKIDNIRQEKKFQEVLSKIKEDADFVRTLQKSAEYSTNMQTDTLPRFTYMNPNDSNLVRVRQYFKLDSVAGAGNEIEKIKNILTYIHNKIRHDGQHSNPNEMTSIAMAEACKDGSRGLNCRGLATVLNECYLAMGFKSRFITCMPEKYIDECHVINTVYSNTLDKWLWVDPTNNAYVMDENNKMLGIAEVRERLRNGQPLILNEDANWNNRSKTLKEEYLDQYMAKNLYYVSCSLRSEYGTENKTFNHANYVTLMPTGYTNDMEKGSFIVNDDAWFWQSPYQD